MGWPGPMTHRQFAAWQAWLAEQWNVPSRTDNYLISIAAEIRRGNVKDPARVKFEHLKLKFTLKGEGEKPITREQAAAWAKARWVGMLGGDKVRVVKAQKAGA